MASAAKKQVNELNVYYTIQSTEQKKESYHCNTRTDKLNSSIHKHLIDVLARCSACFAEKWLDMQFSPY